jgi:hypothetical protein
MDLFSTFRAASSWALCAALVACAGTPDPGPPTVVRTRAPEGYERTINNYFAFHVRGPQTNVGIDVGKPEPGRCALDGYVTSQRGWVVPVVYATRTGAPTGKEAINITAKQYYFWFLGNTMAGITPRIDLCPGFGVAFSEDAQPSARAGGAPGAALPDAQTRDGAAIPAQDRAKAAGGKKHETAGAAKKTGAPSGKVRPAVKKVGNPRPITDE